MKIAMRFYVAALLAIAVSTAFAQGTDDNAFKQRVADAAGKYKSGNSVGALDDFMTLYHENSKNADVDSWIGFLHLRNKEAKKAIPFLEQAKALNPKDLEVLNNLGNAYLMAGQNSRALSTYRDLIALDGNRFQAYYNIGNIQLEDQHFAAAEESFTQALKLQRNSAQVLNNLGVAQEAQGKAMASFASFKRASDLAPKDGTYARNAGASAYKVQNYPVAISYLERALADKTRDSKIILALGDSYGKTGRGKDMTDLYDKNKDAFDGDYKYFFNLGVMKKKDGDLDGAETAFRSASQINGTDPETLNNLGVVLFEKRNFTESRTVFEKLVSIQPTLKNKRNLAAAASRDGDFRTAMPIWSEILQNDKNDQEVRLLLADALYDTGDTKAALTMYAQINTAKPGSAAALDGIGRCHLRNHNLAAAEASLRSSIKADKTFVPAYNNLAVVLEKMNKRSEAIALLEKAASMDGNNADVQKNLKRMRSAG